MITNTKSYYYCRVKSDGLAVLTTLGATCEKHARTLSFSLTPHNTVVHTTTYEVPNVVVCALELEHRHVVLGPFAVQACSAPPPNTI